MVERRWKCWNRLDGIITNHESHINLRPGTFEKSSAFFHAVELHISRAHAVAALKICAGANFSKYNSVFHRMWIMTEK
jgi:hypothetical protein